MGASCGYWETLPRLAGGTPVTPLKVGVEVCARRPAEIRRRQEKCCAQPGSANPTGGETSRSVSLSARTFHSSSIRLRVGGWWGGIKTGGYSSRRGRLNDPAKCVPGMAVSIRDVSPEKKIGSDDLLAAPAGIRASVRGKEEMIQPAASRSTAKMEIFTAAAPVRRLAEHKRPADPNSLPFGREKPRGSAPPDGHAEPASCAFKPPMRLRRCGRTRAPDGGQSLSGGSRLLRVLLAGWRRTCTTWAGREREGDDESHTHDRWMDGWIHLTQ